MLMEQEAPLLFHTVFAGAVILTVAYLLHWRGHSPQKKPLELILYFVLLQIPAYILVFYAMMCPRSGDRTQIKRIRPNEQRYGEEYLKKVLLIFYRINLHRAIRSPARAGRAACLSDGMLLSREVYIKPKGAFF